MDDGGASPVLPSRPQQPSLGRQLLHLAAGRSALHKLLASRLLEAEDSQAEMHTQTVAGGWCRLR